MSSSPAPPLMMAGFDLPPVLTLMGSSPAPPLMFSPRTRAAERLEIRVPLTVRSRLLVVGLYATLMVSAPNPPVIVQFDGLGPVGIPSIAPDSSCRGSRI